MTRAQIEVKNLYKVFGKYPKSVIDKIKQGQTKEEILAQSGHTVGLDNINLKINQGEIFVIMGLSGSGKSTLIRHFNRLIDPTSGDIFVDGINICDLPLSELRAFRKERMAMVFQRFALFPHKTVLQNTAYGLSIQGMDKRQAIAKAKTWIETVGLSGYEEKYPSQLSGGQQQRVGLARALATDADILLMDEAFSALDPLIRSDMQHQLIRLQQKLHKTIIFITHDLDEALRLGDKVAILRDGKLIQQGSPIEILQHPSCDYVADFVNDVNRARALSVNHLMTSVKPLQANLTLEQAKASLEAKDQEINWFRLPSSLDNNNLDNDTLDDNKTAIAQVSLKQLNQLIAQKDNTTSLQQCQWQMQEAVRLNQSIESILPQVLTTKTTLPVIDINQEIIGFVSPDNIAKIYK